MKSLTTIKPGNAVQAGPGAERINAAYEDFCRSTVEKALIVGQLLREQREIVAPFSHNGKMGKFEAKTEGDKFGNWLETHCPRISKTTAYRWMEMADRVSQAALTGAYGKAQVESGCIEIEGATVSFSQMLTAPDAELPQEAREAKQLLLDFVGGKTMKDCLNSVIVDGKDPSAVTRAHNGRTKGGAGGDRKAFDLFTARSLGKLTTFFSYDLTNVQKIAIKAAWGASLQLWPRWLLEAIADKIKSELKLSDAERVARIGKDQQ
jgi:hypothetical protein